MYKTYSSSSGDVAAKVAEGELKWLSSCLYAAFPYLVLRLIFAMQHFDRVPAPQASERRNNNWAHNGVLRAKWLCCDSGWTFNPPVYLKC
ncbi:hypothetical protein FRC08_015557 [Ceratobasidium sp. 394]|nr:hypothetical protein FRC08_015557 [Ceratobasidium sp. 394]